jgi:hypothetical protein
MVKKVDLVDALPVERGGSVLARGDRIEVIGDSPIAHLIRKYLPYMTYTATLTSPPGVGIARVQGTDRIVAFQLQTKGDGLLVGLPATTFDPIEPEDEELGDEEEWPDEAFEFQSDLLAAIAQLSTQGEIAQPGWAINYTTSTKRASQEKVAKQFTILERAQGKLIRFQALAEKELLLDQLYLGTGRQLELRVRDVFTLLGFKVEEPKPGRADWHASADGGSAVLEVKGLLKSAGEKNAAQLEKWVAEAMERTGTSPKGILIANTWRDIPIAERNQPDFPDQMLPYCISRGHCLVTGLDLFVIANDAKREPSRKHFWRKRIIETKGRLVGVPYWTEFITESSITEIGIDQE